MTVHWSAVACEKSEERAFRPVLHKHIQRTLRNALHISQYVSIDHCSLDALMSEKLLYHSDNHEYY